MMFTASEHQRIAAAIASAEATTAGEIFAIVTDARPRYAAVAIGAATLAAFALPLAGVLAGLDPARMLPFDDGWHQGSPRLELLRAIEAYAAWQALIFIGVLALTWFTPLGLWLTPMSIRRERVHREAMKQFLSRGLHVTAERTGVLLYVSLADHVAEVVADEGIYAKVAPELWGDTILALTEGIRSGRAADGFVRAIEMAGGVLAAHFPPRPHNPNELPDKLIEL